MFQRFVFFLLLVGGLMVNGQWSMTFAQSAAIKSLYRTVNDTYETKADSSTNAFIESFMIKSKGIFNDKYQTYAFNAYWTQAHAIDVVIYAYQRHKGINTSLANTYLKYIKLWYKNKANNYAGAPASSTLTPNTTSDYKMFENPYTDDMCWITLTLLHIGEATGTNSYSVVARQVFDNYIIKRAKEDEETGGLWLPWNTDAGSGPNACTQSPATLIAAKLYQKYGTAKYLEYAKKLYAYTSKKIVKSDGRVEEPPLTYTQGTFGEACRVLYHVTDESNTIKNKYKSLAYTYLNYAFTSNRCTNGNNILRHEGTSGDQSIFKAVLIPYAVNYVLDEDMPTSNRTNLCKLIQKNTTTMWKNLDLSRYPIVFCNFDWTKPYTGADKEASMGAACSGASLMENSARMCRAIADRYDLGALYDECSKLVIEPGHENDPELSAFNTAMAKAAEILAVPGSYTTAQFKEAIENLQAAYPAAQDYATEVGEIHNSQFAIHNDIYNLSGQKVSDKLQKGIYIIGGRKVLIK
jgi:predicted alpha-1,6-mannanase (GH76 family)